MPLFCWFDHFSNSRAEIVKFFCWYFGRNDDTKRTFWNQLTFRIITRNLQEKWENNNFLFIWLLMNLQISCKQTNISHSFIRQWSLYENFAEHHIVFKGQGQLWQGLAKLRLHPGVELRVQSGAELHYWGQWSPIGLASIYRGNGCPVQESFNRWHFAVPICQLN